MWKRAVRCKLEGEGGWNQGKEAAYWKYRQDRLRSCRKQGTMGVGTLCLFREAKPCSQAGAWSLPPPPFLEV